MFVKEAAVILLALVATGNAQLRPSYASRQPYPLPKDYSQSEAAPASSSSGALASRFGNVPNDVQQVSDPDIAIRAQQWPDERKPFWLLNAEQILRNRNAEQPKRHR